MNTAINMASVAAELATRAKPAKSFSYTMSVHADRRNIFANIGEGVDARMVGTIISGSKTRLAQFEADLDLLTAAPALRKALELVEGMLRTWEHRNDGENDAQAAFDAFIGAEDAAEVWATVRSALLRAS